MKDETMLSFFICCGLLLIAGLYCVNRKLRADENAAYQQSRIAYAVERVARIPLNDDDLRYATRQSGGFAVDPSTGCMHYDLVCRSTK